MKTLNRKLLRDLWLHKGLLLTVSSIMALGVGCLVSMRSVYLNLETAKDRYYRQCRMADFWIDLKKAPRGEVASLTGLPGVLEVHPRIRFFATVDLEGVLKPLNGLVLSMPQDKPRVPNSLVIQRGGWFTDRRDNEVIVNAAFAREHRLYPGDSVHLLLNNRRQELFIVGTAISSEFTYLLGPGAIIPDPEHFGVFYVKERFAEDVFDFEGAANEVVGRLALSSDAEIDAFLREAEIRLAPYGVFETTPLRRQASNFFLASELDQLAVNASVMPAIFLAVAALVLNVLMTRLARQERTVVGTLKALGYTSGQIFAHFLKFSLCIGLIGGLLGCLIGYAYAGAITSVYTQYYEFPDLRNETYPLIWLAGVALSMACAAVGSSYGISTVLRLQPAEAMRPPPPRGGGGVWVERIGWLWRRLSATWRLAIRSVIRARVRTAAGVFAAAMGAALLVVGFTFMEGVTYLVEFQFEQLARSDIDLAFVDEQSEAALWEARRLPGVDRAEPVLDVGCTFRNGPYEKKGGVTGLAPEAILTVPRSDEGRRLRLPEAGLLMSRRLAELLHVERGDRLIMQPLAGERRPVEVFVAGVADGYLGMSVYADIRYLSRLIAEEYALTGVQMSVDPRGDARRALYRELKQLPALRATTARQEMVNNLRETIVDTQSIFIGVLVAFAGVIFLGSIVNSSLINLAERQREAATFRALGYTPWQVGNMLLRESLMTNLVGAVLGLPVGYLLVLAVIERFENDLIRFPLVTAPWIWLVTLTLALVFTLLAHAFVQWKISTMNFVDALKVQE